MIWLTEKKKGFSCHTLYKYKYKQLSLSGYICWGRWSILKLKWFAIYKKFKQSGDEDISWFLCCTWGFLNFEPLFPNDTCFNFEILQNLMSDFELYDFQNLCFGVHIVFHVSCITLPLLWYLKVQHRMNLFGDLHNMKIDSCIVLI